MCFSNRPFPTKGQSGAEISSLTSLLFLRSNFLPPPLSENGTRSKALVYSFFYILANIKSWSVHCYSRIQVLVSSGRPRHHGFPQSLPLLDVYRSAQRPQRHFPPSPNLTYSAPLSLNKKQTPIQPSRPLPIGSSPNPFSRRGSAGNCGLRAACGGRLAWGATGEANHPALLAPQPRGCIAPLSGPLQGSDQQLVTLLCRNRRHLRSVEATPGRGTGRGSLSKLEARRNQRRKNLIHRGHNFRDPGSRDRRLLPSTSGRRPGLARFLPTPGPGTWGRAELRLREPSEAGPGGRGQGSGRAGAGIGTEVAAVAPAPPGVGV